MKMRANTDRRWLHATLVLLTLLSTFATFFFVFGNESEDLQTQIVRAASFALALVLILGTHEMGHYLFARHYGVDCSLPYFIPLPLLGLGTLGAVIRLRSPIPNRNALMDIGAAGPLAGLAVAIPVYALGIFLSPMVPAPHLPENFLGDTSLWTIIRSLSDGKSLLDGSAQENASTLNWIFGENVLSLGLRALLKGPLPPGQDLLAHPLVIAGWFGTLVTLLNLIPIGQLDGGHVAFALWGPRAKAVGAAAAAGLLFLAAMYSAHWMVWLVVVSLLIRFRHPPVLDDSVPLSPGRKFVALLCGIALLLCLMPVPLRQVWVP